MVVDGIKICGGCKIPKPVSEFYAAKGRGDGLRGMCILCSKSPERRAKKNARYNKRFRSDPDFRMSEKIRLNKIRINNPAKHRERVYRRRKLKPDVYKKEKSASDKTYRQKNLARLNKQASDNQKRHVDTVSDMYIMRLLKSESFPISALNEDQVAELVKVKRILLETKRLTGQSLKIKR